MPSNVGERKVFAVLVRWGADGQRKIRQYFQQFCNDLRTMYGRTYLNCQPTRAELGAVATVYDEAGFPGCVGAVDVLRVHWKNSPSAHKGQHHNSKDGKLATIGVEAWCDHELYIWSWFAGRCDTNKYKTMLASSLLFMDILSGKLDLHLPMSCRLLPGGQSRQIGYCLADGIYPTWPIFFLPMHDASTEAHRRYNKAQEITRKDTERLFGVMQSRFRMLRHESELWSFDNLVCMTEVCVIVHNFLVRMSHSGAFQEE